MSKTYFYTRIAFIPSVTCNLHFKVAFKRPVDIHIFNKKLSRHVKRRNLRVINIKIQKKTLKIVKKYFICYMGII